MRGRRMTPGPRSSHTIAPMLALMLALGAAVVAFGASAGTSLTTGAQPSGVQVLSNSGPGNNSGGNPPVLNYTVTFLGGGLPPGTSWSVMLGGISRTNSGANVVFASIPAGNYTFSVAVPDGFACAPQHGMLSVSADTRLEVTFASTASGSGFGGWPLAPLEVELLVGIAVVGIAAVIAIEVVSRRRAPPADPGTGEDGDGPPSRPR